ncbi:MAG TPA: hypothetical protein ENN69_02360 [Spirochaetia bacterium]|nr:hypothetical protein [Spirochaetia bacterium]
MKYCADLHIHSAFSRSTSKALSLPLLKKWSLIKGIHVLGTGDFTHPAWRQTLHERLIPDGRGFFALKEEPAPHFEDDPWRTEDIPCRFCLSAEISSIYKKNGRTRKVHTLLFAPDLEKADRISLKLEAIGNLKSDGRPILGLDPKHLLEIVKEVSPDCHLIPAHVWTPWFSVFGSHSGFDSLEECFEDLLPEIFALETGLSSDPGMNWRVSGLDRYTLVSNSDAHSAERLMREANLFDTELSYEGLFRALITREGFEGTIEFFPEEGKYHYDGHRKCGVVLSPEETRAAKGICPGCGKPLTVGVLHRIMDLADRTEGIRPPGQKGYRYAVPLPEIIAELTGTGPSAKGVRILYRKAVETAGNERRLLFETPIDRIAKKLDPLLAEAVRRLREGKVITEPGYDGEFGKIRMFAPGELSRLRGQGELWSMASPNGAPRELFEAAAPAPVAEGSRLAEKEPFLPAPAAAPPADNELDEEQSRVLSHPGGAQMVIAGPGTGKTRTLTHWLARVVDKDNIDPQAVVALTFTFKAREELLSRLQELLGARGRAVTVTTFHALCYDIITAWYPEVKSIYDDAGRKALLRFLSPAAGRKKIDELSDRLAAWLDGTRKENDPALDTLARDYQAALREVRGVDVASLISSANLILEERSDIRTAYTERFRVIAVDEFQDINHTQYRFLTHLIGIDPKTDGRNAVQRKRILVIGDPDQSIYGFRGGEPRLFYRFQNDYQAAYATLERNFRSTGTILEGAGGVISRNAFKSGLSLRAVRETGRRILVTGLADEREEAEYAARLVKKLLGGTDLIESGEPFPWSDISSGRAWSFRDIGVLARTHRVLETAADGFLRHGLPVALRNERAFLAEEPYSFLMELFRFLFNKEDIVAFQNITARFLPELSHQARAAIMQTHRISRGETAVIAGLEPAASVLSGAERKGLDSLVRFLEFVEAEIDTQGVAKGLFLLLEKLHEGRSFLSSSPLHEQALQDLARGYGTDLSRFVREVFLSPRESGCTPPVERISFLTFHAAKGLEFPVVLIVGAEEGITPLDREDADLEEERRLFYTAMTRAGDLLAISHVGQREYFGNVRKQAPSRFLFEIPRNTVSETTQGQGRKKYYQPSLF